VGFWSRLLNRNDTDQAPDTRDPDELAVHSEGAHRGAQFEQARADPSQSGGGEDIFELGNLMFDHPAEFRLAGALVNCSSHDEARRLLIGSLHLVDTPLQQFLQHFRREAERRGNGERIKQLDGLEAIVASFRQGRASAKSGSSDERMARWAKSFAGATRDDLMRYQQLALAMVQASSREELLEVIDRHDELPPNERLLFCLASLKDLARKKGDQALADRAEQILEFAVNIVEGHR